MVRAALVAIGGGLPMAGCMTPELPAISMPALGGPASNASGSHGTVAFESIDGPPEPLFRKLVTQLAQEANARQVAMVSRDSPAQYRIRGYVAAHVQGTKTTLSWVWDVYDADRERAVRFAGEVPGAPSERAWAAADDQVVTRIARAMQQERRRARCCYERDWPRLVWRFPGRGETRIRRNQSPLRRISGRAEEGLRNTERPRPQITGVPAAYG